MPKHIQSLMKKISPETLAKYYNRHVLLFHRSKHSLGLVTFSSGGLIEQETTF